MLPGGAGQREGRTIRPSPISAHSGFQSGGGSDPCVNLGLAPSRRRLSNWWKTYMPGCDLLSSTVTRFCFLENTTFATLLTMSLLPQNENRYEPTFEPRIGVLAVRCIGYIRADDIVPPADHHVSSQAGPFDQPQHDSKAAKIRDRVRDLWFRAKARMQAGKRFVSRKFKQLKEPRDGSPHYSPPLPRNN